MGVCCSPIPLINRLLVAATVAESAHVVLRGNRDGAGTTFHRYWICTASQKSTLSNACVSPFKRPVCRVQHFVLQTAFFSSCHRVPVGLAAPNSLMPSSPTWFTCRRKWYPHSPIVGRPADQGMARAVSRVRGLLGWRHEGNKGDSFTIIITVGTDSVS